MSSLHGIGIVVLNEWMKCATKTQPLLASTPCSHNSHMITLVTVHDFMFQLSMISLTHFEDFATYEYGSTCNRCACTRFKTPEQPSSYKASGEQSNISVTLKWILNWCVGAQIYIKRYDIKARTHLAFDLNGITQLGDWCMDAYNHSPWRARDYMYPSTNLPRCVMSFRSKTHAFWLYWNIVCEIAVILSRSQCVNITNINENIIK